MKSKWSHATTLKIWLIAVVLFWVAVVANAVGAWRQDFDSLSLSSLGLMLVLALSMTVIWWALNTRQNGLGSTTADTTAL